MVTAIFVQVSDVGIALQNHSSAREYLERTAARFVVTRVKAFLQVKTHLMAKMESVPVPVRSFLCAPSSSTFAPVPKYCFMVPQENVCCCGRAAICPNHHEIAPAIIIGIERPALTLMYCTHAPVNCASGWRKNSTMIRNAPYVANQE